MRTAFAPLALLLLAALALPPAQAQAQKTIKQTVPLASGGEVVIDTYKGSVAVTTWDQAEVVFEVTIEADGDEELVELTEIAIDRSANRLRLETDYEQVEEARKKGWGPFSWSGSTSLPFAHYTIRMPRTAQLVIDDYKSEIKIAGVGADVRLESYKGTMDVEGVQGALDLETYKGEAVVSGLDGGLRVDTYKGDVRVAFSRLAGDVAAETYKGEVALVLPADAGFTLDADLSRKGDLDTDLFDPSDLRRDPEDDDQKYRGSVAGGGPLLELETYKGTFTLRGR